jgi:hypothetical protein
MWATVISGNQWMNCVGRLAFPIFAFMIAEGYSHTSNFKKYAMRLFVFGLVSEIPFDLMCTGAFFFPFHQNVMFTLLLGLLCINEIDKFKKTLTVKSCIFCLLKIGLFLLIGTVGFVDYNAMGIMVVIAFYVFRNFRLAPLFQLVSLVLLFWVFFKGQGFIIPVGGRELFLPVQAFGILALIPIWLYNGEKGSNSKMLKYAFYAFYPTHMALIYIAYKLFF